MGYSFSWLHTLMTWPKVASSRLVSELYKVEVVFLSLLESVLPTCLNATISNEKFRIIISFVGLSSIKSVWIQFTKELFGFVIAWLFIHTSMSFSAYDIAPRTFLSTYFSWDTGHSWRHYIYSVSTLYGDSEPFAISEFTTAVSSQSSPYLPSDNPYSSKYRRQCSKYLLYFRSNFTLLFLYK